MTETVPDMRRVSMPTVSPSTWMVGRCSYPGTREGEYEAIRRRIPMTRTASESRGSSNAPAI